MKRIPLIAIAGLLNCGSAWALTPAAEWNWQPRWFAGGSVGQASFDDWSAVDRFDDGSYTSDSTDESGTGYTVFGGVEFLQHLALELGYADFGSASHRAQSDGSAGVWAAGPIRESLDLSGITLSVQGSLPLTSRTALFARVGMLQWETDGHLTGTTQAFGPINARESDDGTDLTFGGGISFDLLETWRLRLSYTRYAFETGSEDAALDALDLSMAYFLQ